MKYMEQKQQARKTKRELVNPMYNDRALILKTSNETGGRYSLGELTVNPGGGNHLHIHTAFRETFTAVEGTLGVMFGKKKIFLKAGDSITVPLRTPHNFFNSGSKPVIAQVKLEPGHEGFEKGIAIGYGLAGDGLTDKKGTPKSFTHLALLIDLTNTRPSGAMSLMMPLIKWVANRARKKGIENELLEKYYYE
jgi:mannose-6-phosphate isomerase-like protein (cupin superfamily)